MKKKPTTKQVITSLIIIITALGLVFIASYALDKYHLSKADRLVSEIVTSLNKELGDNLSREKECKSERSGAWGTGDKICTSSTVFAGNSASLSDIESLHKKAFSIVTSNSSLNPTDPIKVTPPDLFETQVNGKVQQFYNLSDASTCTYSFETDGAGFKLKFECSTKTQSSEY
jgi:hypothetical protein